MEKQDGRRIGIGMDVTSNEEFSTTSDQDDLAGRQPRRRPVRPLDVEWRSKGMPAVAVSCVGSLSIELSSDVNISHWVLL
jgi:hypothetical protein